MALSGAGFPYFPDSVRDLLFYWRSALILIPMNNMFLLPAILLAAAAVTDLAFIISDNTKLRVFSKPALLPLIIFLYLSLTANPAWFILGGLIAGWIGDILLLSKRPASFLSGLSSFLIGHIFYIAALLQGIGRVSMTPGIFSLILAMMLAAWLILRFDLAPGTAVSVGADTVFRRARWPGS
jgi:uncharacterized membrane protein YhhN